jgi:hypothetical protein
MVLLTVYRRYATVGKRNAKFKRTKFSSLLSDARSEVVSELRLHIDLTRKLSSSAVEYGEEGLVPRTSMVVETLTELVNLVIS